MEILTRYEFWKRNPAPGTRYYPIYADPSEIIANNNEWLEDYEIDNVIQEQHEKSKSFSPIEYIVLEWGTWESEEAANAKRIHRERIDLLWDEFGEPHDCRIGF